jgi:DNA-binding HxlR family transcriptional regulator
MAKVPPRAEYDLTELAFQLIAHVKLLTEWDNGRANDFRVARWRFATSADV